MCTMYNRLELCSPTETSSTPGMYIVSVFSSLFDIAFSLFSLDRGQPLPLTRKSLPKLTQIYISHIVNSSWRWPSHQRMG
jgi:hypothetical protein